MLVVGIDENGLGPLLGPLVVTATLLSVADLEPLLRGSLRESKEIFRSGKKMEEGERYVLSFFHLLKGYIPSQPKEILKELLLPLDDTCISPLPHCQPDFKIPHWCNISEINENEAKTFLQEVGAELLEVKSIALCPAQLNKRLQSYNKNHIDYLLFEELMIYFKRKFKEDILFLCGGIGTTKSYENYFRHLASLTYKKTEWNEEELSYSFPSFGEVRFIKDGERYFPIALSSDFGKYIRELFVEQMNSFFRDILPSLPYCSGYRDEKTKLFVEATEDLRERLGIPPICFLRSL
ncbi:MAG: hypothetical protein ACPL7E_08225 [bacterium]